jgi:hypothetical protein
MPDLRLDLLDQGHDLIFLPRIAAEGVRLTARHADGIHLRPQLLRRPACDAGDEALLRKAARDGASGGIARADGRRHF